MTTRSVPFDSALAVDILVVGAGFAGLYASYRAKEAGYHFACVERATDVGGTWYWNRYPGARCDIESLDYSYSFDDALQQEWEWTEKFATQPEILRYLQHVAERYDLRRHINFGTTVESARFDEESSAWIVQTDAGQTFSAKFLILAVGNLSAANSPDIEGLDSFVGNTYHTANWPHEGVDFTGRRVGVIGTGSSGIQAIPLIAERAAHLAVFQRTPNYSLPAQNAWLDPEAVVKRKESYSEYRREARHSFTGVPVPTPTQRALDVSTEERLAAYEAAWRSGKYGALLRTYVDLLTDRKANDTASEFVRAKVRELVDDPELAEVLAPGPAPFGTKRTCLDTGYYETFNRSNVSLVDILEHPIVRVVPSGVETTWANYDLDDLVLATGFDAMTGSIVNINPVGRDHRSLRSEWSAGPHTFLGLASAGFPNLFFITGPGSPSVLSNMVVSIEQHVDWVMDLIAYMRARGWELVEPSFKAQEDWVKHVNEAAAATLYPEGNSWYLGANIPGKPRVFMPYVNGVGEFRRICDQEAAEEYPGLVLSRSRGDAQATHSTIADVSTTPR